MRTGILKEQIKEYYKLLELKSERVSLNNNIYYKILNWKNINTALFKLNEFEFMGNSVKEIFDMGANLMASTDITYIQTNNYLDFLNKINIVKAKCEAIIDIYSNEINSEDEKNNLYIKIPEGLNDLEDLEKIVKGLDLSFNKCPILRENYEKINFVGVDVGSSWIVLSVILTTGIPKGLNWIADFIKKCNEIRIQNRQIKQMDLDYLMKKMEFDEKQSLKYKEKIENGIEDDLKEQCINKFKKIDFPNKDKISKEDEAKIVHCMSTMSQLLDMGVEIYPSANVDDNLKSLFPKKEEWKKISGDTKLLTDKK